MPGIGRQSPVETDERNCTLKGGYNASTSIKRTTCF